MEVSQSLRLFGGLAALQERIREEAPQLGVQSMAWSSNSLAALALARAGSPALGRRRPSLGPEGGGRAGVDAGEFAAGLTLTLSEQLDHLPLHSLSATHPHLATLTRLGCSTLGHLRTLPRGGLRRRFDRELLQALDQAYGLRPETHTWHTLPETFTARLDLMARVEQAPALLFGARRLLLALCAWLAARHEGVTACRLRWTHDGPRSQAAGTGGELILRTGTPTRDIEHLSRLLAEHLAHVRLAAPVEGLELTSLVVQSLPDSCASLLPGAAPGQEGESLGLVMERIAARLGAERVLRPQARADHRLEWMTHWHAATAGPTRAVAADPGCGLPQPCFVLPEPLKLPMQGAHPVYHGALRFLTGPHRVEAGWWDRPDDGAVIACEPSPAAGLPFAPRASLKDSAAPRQASRHVARDYWVALSEQAGVLWVFQERRPEADASWYLHGIFA